MPCIFGTFFVVTSTFRPRRHKYFVSRSLLISDDLAIEQLAYLRLLYVENFGHLYGGQLPPVDFLGDFMPKFMFEFQHHRFV